MNVRAFLASAPPESRRRELGPLIEGLRRAILATAESCWRDRAIGVLDEWAACNAGMRGNASGDSWLEKNKQRMRVALDGVGLTELYGGRVYEGAELYEKAQQIFSLMIDRS